MTCDESSEAGRRGALCAVAIGTAIWRRIRDCGGVGGGALRGRSAGSCLHASVLNLVLSRRGSTPLFRGGGLVRELLEVCGQCRSAPSVERSADARHIIPCVGDEFVPSFSFRRMLVCGV